MICAGRQPKAYGWTSFRLGCREGTSAEVLLYSSALKAIAVLPAGTYWGIKLKRSVARVAAGQPKSMRDPLLLPRGRVSVADGEVADCPAADPLLDLGSR